MAMVGAQEWIEDLFAQLQDGFVHDRIPVRPILSEWAGEDEDDMDCLPDGSIFAAGHWLEDHELKEFVSWYKKKYSCE